MFLRRAVFVLLLVCLGCAAQSSPSKPQAPNSPSSGSTAQLPNGVGDRIEKQVRSYYNIPPQVKVLFSNFHPSPDFPNFDALTITFDGGERKQAYDFLLSKDDKTLARLTKLDLTKDPYAENMSKLDITGRPVRGNKSAKVVVVNFDDFQCPFCSKMHQTLFPEMLKEYGDSVMFVYKDFPLQEIHPWATRAAVDANCLAAQNEDAYWDFADYIHANQRQVNSQSGRDAQFAELDKIALSQGQKHNVDATKLQACVKAQNEDQVKASMKEAQGLGVQATPTMFVNGQELDGALPIAEVRATLDQALVRAGVTPPTHPAEPAASTGGQGSSK